MAHALVAARANVDAFCAQEITVVLISLASVDLELTNTTSPTVTACALECINHIGASAAVHARR